MIPVLDRSGMREADRITIEELGVPGLALMELAASAVTEVVAERLSAAGPVAIVCGAGNNGADGLAVARQLRARGVTVEVWLTSAEKSMRGDAARQLELARSFAVPIRAVRAAAAGALDASLAGADLVVDAIFGTGLDRALEGDVVEVVRAINRCGRPVVAVDLPSGLDGSSGGVAGEAVDAAVTVTFAAPKVAHVLPPACFRCGEVAVADIGIPRWAIEARSVHGLIEEVDVAGWLPRRPVDAHKGHFGHLLIVAGRVGRAGAASLAARAAVRSGAGLVTVATAAGAVTPIQAQVPEAMVDPLPEGHDGEVTGEGLVALLGKATALAVGPGMGLGEGPRLLLATVLESWPGPLLLDADALTLLAGRLGSLAGRSATTVLTPHPGELARLLGWETERVVADRLAAARAAAAESGACVLAKGPRTIVVEAVGPGLVNPTGGPGLASGGSGDVLAGTIAALLAQGVPGREAAAAGAWLHGRAAELAAASYPGAVPAGALAEYLPAAEAELREES